MSQIITKFITDLAVTNAKVAAGIGADKIADGSVSNTEFQYLSGVTSDIQTQLNSRLDGLGVAYFDTDHTLSNWAPNVPGLVFDGTTTEATTAFATGIAMLGNGSQAFLIITTEFQNAGSNNSADINIFSGDTVAPATGSSGGVYMYSGASVGPSGPAYLQSGSSSAGSSGLIQVTSGNASTVSGDIQIKTGDSAGGDTGDIVLEVGLAGGTPGDFRFIKGGVPSVVGQVWTATGIAGEGYWAAAPSGAFDPATDDLIFTKSGTAFVKTEDKVGSPSEEIRLETGTSDTTETGSIVLYSGSSGTAGVTTGSLSLFSGQSIGTGGNSGDVNFGSSIADGNTGNMLLRTGISSNGDSGNIWIDVGTAVNGTRGKVRITDGSEGTIGHVWTSTSVNGEGEWAAPSGGGTHEKETFTLSAGDITNQYIDLANVAKVDSIHFIVKGGAPTLEGASHDYSVNYTGGAGGNSRITFLNDLATGGAAELVAGDIIQVVYVY